ncbi:rRNA adenine N-6-methyltransferase family protein [soil metagenome]
MSNGTPAVSRRRLFAQNFFKHPRMLGSLVPSSRFLVDQLLRQIDWPNARTIVEYGPGVGTFTGEILKRMRPDARLIVLEMNPSFVAYLRSHLDDDRLVVAHSSAGAVQQVLADHQLQSADYIISGIPFSTIPPDERQAILKATHESLATGGEFLVYQFSSKVLPHLKVQFGYVRTDFEPLNILPARLFYCSP